MKFAHYSRALLLILLFILGTQTWGILSSNQNSLAESSGIATGQSKEQIAEIQAIVLRQSAAWNRGDISDFMVPYWHDERLTFSSGGTTTRGWEPTFERYKNKYPDQATMGKLEFGDLESQSLGEDVVLMLGTWKLERAEPAQGNFTLVWKRVEGKWVIIHDHSSLLRKTD